MIRWEVWIHDVDGWRFNACFDAKKRADEEARWYSRHGVAVEVRARTTRFQRREHITTGRR